MTTLHCRPSHGRASRIEIQPGSVAGRGDWLRREEPARARFVLADRRVLELHPGTVPKDAACLSIGAGEGAKTFAVLERVVRAMAARALDRRAVLVALGGGSIGDLGGLAASLYLRGIELLQVPTTLLAMVDSSVGGKTAINLPEGKNLAGSYWPAATVSIDPGFVATLDEDEFRSGLGEALKIAIGLSAELFELLECRRDAVLRREVAALREVIELALGAKIRIVEQDPTERGPRRLLNLGHTLGHALEAASDFSVPHGVAVARGLHFAIDRAEALGCLAAGSAERGRRLLRDHGFAPDPLPPWQRLNPYLRRDKKHEGDRLHVVLPEDVGRSRVVTMSLAEFTGRAAPD